MSNENTPSPSNLEILTEIHALIGVLRTATAILEDAAKMGSFSDFEAPSRLPQDNLVAIQSYSDALPDFIAALRETNNPETWGFADDQQQS